MSPKKYLIHRIPKKEKQIKLPKMKVRAQICVHVLNCSIPPSLFGAAALMGNQSSNKAADCRSIQTLSLWFLSLKDTNNTDTESGHVYQGLAMDPTLHLCPGGWAFQLCIAFTVHLSMIMSNLCGFIAYGCADACVCAPLWLVRACRGVCSSPTLLLFALQCSCRSTSMIMKHMRIHSLWTAQPQRASKVDMSPTHRWK